MNTCTQNYWIVGTLIALSTAMHLLPFLLYGAHPLGYDTGFYRRYLIQPFSSFPNTPVPGLGKDAVGPRIFLDTVRIFHLPIDIILYGSYIVFFAAESVALFFLVKRYGNTHVGIIVALLFILSPVQYTAYWFMFFKNAFATAVVLLAFLLIEKKSRLALPVGMLIAMSHHTSSIIFLLSLAVFLVINREKRKRALSVFLPTALVFLLFHFGSYQDYLTSQGAVFMNAREYIILSLPLLFLAAWGLKKAIKTQARSLASAFALVSIAFPLFSLPFYERIFIFTDITIIILAALGIERIIHEMPASRNVMIKISSLLGIIIAFTWVSITTYGQIKNLRPLISGRDLEALQSLSTHIPFDAAIITSTVLAPWVQGWSTNRVFAPGLLRDTHLIQEWVSFSEGSREAKIAFLKNFPRPLYIFLASPEKEAFFANFQTCAQEEARYLFKYTC